MNIHPLFASLLSRNNFLPAYYQAQAKRLFEDGLIRAQSVHVLVEFGLKGRWTLNLRHEERLFEAMGHCDACPFTHLQSEKERGPSITDPRGVLHAWLSSGVLRELNVAHDQLHARLFAAPGVPILVSRKLADLFDRLSVA